MVEGSAKHRTEDTDAAGASPRGETEFERQAARQAGGSGPISEFWYFLKRTRKWWMAPIILALLTVGALLVVSGTAVAPLIYAVF